MSFDGVLLTVLAVLVGLFAGFARRGRVLAMAATDVRAKSLLVVGIGVPALAEQFTRDVAVPLVIGGMAALFVFALANVRIAGMSVLAIGVLANLLPTFLNGGLPVRPQALVEAGIVQADELDRVEVRGARRLEEPTQQLRFLGDVIPLPETSQVLSFGDLIVLVGLADVTANLTLARRRRRAGRAESPADAATHAPLTAEADPFALPPIDELLQRAVRSHVDAGRPYDPRPVPRHHAPPAEPVVPGDDLVWTLEPELEEDDTEPAAAAMAAVDGAAQVLALGALGPDVVWWTPDDPPPVEPHVGEPEIAEPEIAEAAIPEAEIMETAIPEPEIAEAVIMEAAIPEPEIPEPEIAEAAIPEPEVVDTGGTEGSTPDEPDAETVDELPAIDLTEHEVWRTFDDARARQAARTDAVDLVTLATADPDELFRALIGDLPPRRRTRRRGGRHIPDFEPIHLDDEPARRG
jgi:hypothetical protein